MTKPLNALAIGPFLSGGFDGFFSLLTLYQLSKNQQDNVLRATVNPVDVNQKDIILSKEEKILLDKHHLPHDLTTPYYFRKQDLYYVVTNYANLVPTIQHLQLNENENLRNILIFITESKDLDTDLAKHVRKFLENELPTKFKKNIVYLDNLVLKDFKVLLADYVKDLKELSLLTQVKKNKEKFGFAFLNSNKINFKDLESFLFSLKGIDTLFIKASVDTSKEFVELLNKVDKSKMKIKNIYVLEDPMSFQELASLIENKASKKLFIFDEHKIYTFK